jgi:hypothetical protein
MKASNVAGLLLIVAVVVAMVVLDPHAVLHPMSSASAHPVATTCATRR